MNPEKGIAERLALALEGKNLSAISRESGIGHSLIRKYAAGSIPGADNIAPLANALGVSIIWLVTGSGNMRLEDASETVGWQPQQPTSVPVIGLAECGLRGWFAEGSMSVRASRPGDLRNPEAFAVMAVGQSMLPAGIHPGFLCFCDPADSPDPGDAVFVERQDGRASIKVFSKSEPGWITLQGWLNPENGMQESYLDKLAASQIKKIATVVYVKRKL